MRCSDGARVQGLTAKPPDPSRALTLNYLARETVLPRPLVTGDSYADEARHYAMKFSWVAIAIFVLFIVLAVLAGMQASL